MEIGTQGSRRAGEVVRRSSVGCRVPRVPREQAEGVGAQEKSRAGQANWRGPLGKVHFPTR